MFILHFKVAHLSALLNEFWFLIIMDLSKNINIILCPLVITFIVNLVYVQLFIMI